MRRSNSELDRLRDGRSELENHYIDELVAGQREPPGVPAPRQHDRHVGAAAGRDPGRVRRLVSRHQLELGSSSTSAAPAPHEGRDVEVGAVAPSAAVNPLTVADAGGLCMLNQTGEFLIFDTNLKLALQPMLALELDAEHATAACGRSSCGPGVKFHNGQPMTADDVVYTFQQLVRPEERLQRAVHVQRRADAGRREEGRRHRRSSSTSRRRTATSPTWSPRTTTTRSSSPRGPTSPSGRARSSAPARSSSAATRRTSARRSCPTRTTGAPSRCCRGTSFKFYTSQPPMILALQGGDVDVIAQFVPCRRARAAEQLARTRSSS